MIDTGKITLVEKEKQCFIRYELSAEEKMANIEAEMLKNNKIPHMLAVSEIKEDENTVLLYDITGKIQLMQRFYAPFSCEELYKMLQGLCLAWLLADEYMLDRRHFLLSPEFLCMDQESGELFLMDLPVSAADTMESEFCRALAGILQHIHYYDEDAPGFFSVLLEYVSNYGNVPAKDFAEFLEQAYQDAQGVLLPVSDAPSVPESMREERKQIVEEDIAKEILKERFRAQDDEVKMLEDAGKGSMDLKGAEKKKSSGGFLLPSGKEQEKTGKHGSFFVPPPNQKKASGTGSILEGKKKKMPKEEKIKKEKQPLPTAASVPKVPAISSVPKASEGKKKEENTGKEKKGLFHIFGKKKEKEEKTVQEPEEEKLMPVEEFPDKRMTRNGGFSGNGEPRNSRYVTGNGNPRNGGYVSGNGNSFYGENQKHDWNFSGNDQNAHPVRGSYYELSGRNGMPIEPVQVQYAPWSFPADRNGGQQAVKKQAVGKQVVGQQESHAEEVDLDATILSNGGLDLDATILDGGSSMPAQVPVLRSRETGEIIKISGSGFLVGRQRMKNGVVVKLPNEKQPDLILPLQNISHSHASFFQKEETWFVKDEDSLNGTFVNEENIGKGGERALAEGDVVRFASEEYEFLVMEE